MYTYVPHYIYSLYIHIYMIRTVHTSLDLNNDYFSTDERRLAHLMSKLNSTEVSGSSATSSRSTIGGGGKANSVKSEAPFAGGIFSRLDAQFRAQQAAKALSLQSTQTR